MVLLNETLTREKKTLKSIESIVQWFVRLGDISPPMTCTARCVYLCTRARTHTHILQIVVRSLSCAVVLSYFSGGLQQAKAVEIDCLASSEILNRPSFVPVDNPTSSRISPPVFLQWDDLARPERYCEAGSHLLPVQLHRQRRQPVERAYATLERLSLSHSEPSTTCVEHLPLVPFSGVNEVHRSRGSMIRPTLCPCAFCVELCVYICVRGIPTYSFSPGQWSHSSFQQSCIAPKRFAGSPSDKWSPLPGHPCLCTNARTHAFCVLYCLTGS